VGIDSWKDALYRNLCVILPSALFNVWAIYLNTMDWFTWLTFKWGTIKTSVRKWVFFYSNSTPTSSQNPSGKTLLKSGVKSIGITFNKILPFAQLAPGHHQGLREISLPYEYGSLWSYVKESSVCCWEVVNLQW